MSQRPVNSPPVSSPQTATLARRAMSAILGCFVRSCSTKLTSCDCDVFVNYSLCKGKGFPYSLPSVGPGADPGVQAVSPHVT